MNKNFAIFTFISMLLFMIDASFSQESSQDTIKKAELGKTINVHQIGDLFLAGQPSKDDLKVIKEKGIKKIISLRSAKEIDWDEKTKVEELGLEYINIPIASVDALTEAKFNEVRKLLNDSDKSSLLLHCASANRVGAVWLTHRVLDQEVPLEKAVKEAKQVGLKSPALQDKALKYIISNQSK